MAAGYSTVYFIQAAPGWPIKIGLSYNVSRRVTALRMNCGLDLQVLGVMDDGTRDMELMIHRRFREHRLVGEWFKPVDDLLKYIEKNARPWGDFRNCDRPRRPEYLPPLDGLESFPQTISRRGPGRALSDDERRRIQDEEIVQMDRAGYERWRIAAITGLSSVLVSRRLKDISRDHRDG